MKIILRLSRFAWRALLACLVSAALALTFVRVWLLPRAAEWRGELQAEIGRMTGETVQIKALSAGLRGFKPELMMRGFRIENPEGGPGLEFQRLGVGLDLVGSALSRKPVIDRIELEGGRLRLLRRADGRVAAADLRPSEHPPAWLFAEGEVRFTDIDLEWLEGENSPAMPLGRAHARLRNQGGRHRLDARVDLPGKLGKSAHLSAEVDGNPLLPVGWNGRAYVEAKRLREGAFRESLDLKMRSGEASLQAWGEWRDGVLRGAVGRLDLDRPVFSWHREGRPEAMLGLDKLGGWLAWRREGAGWRLDVRRFTLAHKGRPWPESDFALAVEPAPDGGLQALRAGVDYLRLDEALALLESLPVLDEAQRETLKSWSPRGEVRAARLVYEAGGRLGFCGELAGLSLAADADRPGLERFNGSLCGNDRNGRLDVNLGKTELKLPALFPRPLALDALSGKLAWSRRGGNLVFADRADPPPPGPDFVGPPPVEESSPLAKLFADSDWRIAGNQLRLAAPGLQAEAGFALELPGEGGGSPTIDLQARLREVDAARLRDYLPLAAMSESAAQWHGGAYRGGRVPEASVLLRGRLADFPFPAGEGLFEARVAAEAMEVEFNPQWPRLYGVNAQILFFGPALFIDSEGGRIGELPLKPVHAEAASLEGDAWLGVAGNFDTELGQALKFLQQTPVRQIPQRLSKAADASGPAHLDLQLAIPLGAGDTAVNGLLQLQNDTLAVKGADLKVTELAGFLNITENGADGKGLTGRAMDEALIIDVDHTADDIVLDAVGKASVAALRTALPGNHWRHAEGGFDYRLRLQIPKPLEPAGAPLRAELSSDLAGLELKLPLPLGKPAAQKKDFSAQVKVRRGESAWQLAYGAEGRARLLFTEAGLASADVFWNRPAPPADWEPGLGLHLKLAELDAAPWHRLLAGLGGGAMAPRAFDVQLGKLHWDGEDYGDFRLTGSRQDGVLAGEIDCLYGKGIYTAAELDSNPAVKLELDVLNLPKLPDDPGKQTPPDPARLPALQIHARQVLRQGAELGELDLETGREAAGLDIRHLNLRAENHNLRLQGGWTRQEGRDQTRLEGRLDVRDLGNLLALLGYGREIVGSPGESTFSLRWQGAPQQFAAATLAGEVRLKLGRGRVLQVEPGLGRALGMLNLQTLRRLVLLDFSDLFGKGLAYDSMAGDFELEAGQARTKGFVIDAAAADILIIGRVGLAAHDLDEIVSVLPHPLASIPLALPMAGGAAVGAVIDLANRLVGADEVNLTSTNYAVTGSWDDPQIKRVQGSTPLEVIDRTWANIKGLSGMGENK